MHHRTPRHADSLSADLRAHHQFPVLPDPWRPKLPLSPPAVYQEAPAECGGQPGPAAAGQQLCTDPSLRLQARVDAEPQGRVGGDAPAADGVPEGEGGVEGVCDQSKHHR